MGESEEWLANEQFAPISSIPDAGIRERMISTINLMENTTRGLLGEVLVAQALDGRLTAPWDSWDVELPSGVRLEVKTTGVYQAWPQTKPYSAAWGIARSAAWQISPDGYTWDPTQSRRSDWYVFAIHHGVEPGNTDEWTFRPTKTSRLEALVGHRKRLGVVALDRLFEPPVLAFGDLASWAQREGLA